MVCTFFLVPRKSNQRDCTGSTTTLCSTRIYVAKSINNDYFYVPLNVKYFLRCSNKIILLIFSTLNRKSVLLTYKYIIIISYSAYNYYYYYYYYYFYLYLYYTIRLFIRRWKNSIRYISIS
jgi:hypothetical protein